MKLALKETDKVELSDLFDGPTAIAYANDPASLTKLVVEFAKNNNNLVKSIASYNAGPHNVKRWVKSLVAPNDAWVEFIPFNETQKYVKNIMEYMIVYDWVINKKQTLDIKKLMGLK